MGITGLIPFIEKASRRANVGEFSGCTVAIDSYCWLHKGAFACADKLVRGEDTDVHIKYCMKYVNMLLSKNIKPILVFDGRHLPAKAMTEAKRRESRDISKKRAAELLSLGQVEEARSYIRRSVDITHEIALALMRECRRAGVDCIVAPHEADAQLAYLNIHNYAHCVITEDSDLILFKCTKVLFKMDLEGNGILVDTVKLPLVMRCPIERYSFDKFRQMCIMSGCDYLASLPGIGLAKARQFVVATQDSNFVNALKKLPSFFNKSSLSVSEEYRESFLKAEATFKYQYVYDPIERRMKRLNDIDNPEVEEALCVNAGEYLNEDRAFQLALGNLDPFTMKKVDDWHPDRIVENGKSQSANWKSKPIKHPSIWSPSFQQYLTEPRPWLKKEPKRPEPIIAIKTRPVKKVVNLVSKYVPETQDESLTIESLTNMYCKEPQMKKQKVDIDLTLSTDSQMPGSQVTTHNQALLEDEISSEMNTQKSPSPILENKERSFRKCIKNSSYTVLKRLSKFPRTVVDNNLVESKFFSSSTSETTEETEDKKSSDLTRNPFKINTETQVIDKINTIDSESYEILDAQETLNSSQKENSPDNSPLKINDSPILESSPRVRNPFMIRDMRNEDMSLTEDSVIENTYPMETLVTPVDSQLSYGESTHLSNWRSSADISPPKPTSQPVRPSVASFKRSTCKVPGLRRTASLPTNQPTLISKFGFQKKPAMKR